MCLLVPCTLRGCQSCVALVIVQRWSCGVLVFLLGIVLLVFFQGKGWWSIEVRERKGLQTVQIVSVGLSVVSW